MSPKTQKSTLVSMLALFALVSMHLAPAAAAAAEIPGGLSLGPRAAFYDPKDGDGKFYGGLQARLHLGPVLAVEGSIDYRREDFDSTKVHVWPVMASALIYLLPELPVSPFLLGGAGWYYTTVKGPGGFDETQHRFGVHAGGGLQLFVAKTVSIDGTYRFVWLEKIESKDVALLDKDFNDNGHMVTVAVNFHF